MVQTIDAEAPTEVMVDVNFSTFDELNNIVSGRDNLVTVSMRQLRDAHGVRRLGRYVLAAIKDTLSGMGLDTYPGLTRWQETLIRVYKRGSPAAKLVQAVLEPSSEHDQQLRLALGGNAQGVLNQVRELVCD